MSGLVSVVAGPARRRLFLGFSLALAVGLEASVASAGGFELPDNGTQALARGAAFVAKASDGTAIQYNPAGLARQRGTHLLLNGNLFLHSFEFQRIGAFPDDPEDAQTPWGGLSYPAVKNIAPPFLVPFAALTTDFGYFDRLTFAAGIFGPPTVANRTFPLSVGGAPSASRYDFVQSRSSHLHPTLAGAFRVTRWLDIGVSGHLVLANFDQTMMSYADLGAAACSANAAEGVNRGEDFRCDTEGALKASGTSFAATFGAMLRPSRSVAFGASFRTPTNVSANGTYTPQAPSALPADQEVFQGSANLALQLPWAARVGGRYIGMAGDFELYDLELDVVYEGWASAQRLGPIMTVRDTGAFGDVQSVVEHGYKDTFGIRAGGAYNFDTGSGVLSLRGGGFFDSSATDFATTRLDYDTLAKVAGTFGLGYKLGAFGFDVGYAAIASIPRTVGTGAGAIRPINVNDGGSTDGADGASLPAVNEGAYRGFTHIFSFGLGVSIDGLFGPPRPIHYGNAYEPNYAGPREPGDSSPAPVPIETVQIETVPIETTPVLADPPTGAKSPEAVLAEPPPAETKPVETKPVETKPSKKPLVEEPAPKPEPAPPVRPAPAPVPVPVPVPVPEVKKPAPPPKPPRKRKEWWEDPD